MRPWGSAAYVHDSSHKYEKLGPRGKKCIFIRYSEQSKGYVFLGEHSEGGLTEIELRDATFIEDEFPSKGEIDKEFQLCEIEDFVGDDTHEPSGSEYNPHGSKLRRNNHQIIP